MNGKRFSEDKARRNGFYLALAVCLVAVGIAAWSTYDAVHGYLEPEGVSAESGLIQQQDQDVRSGQETAGIADDDDPEAPKTASSKPAEEAAGTVTVKPESSAAESTSGKAAESSKAPESQPDPSEAAQEPATAPLYEISTEMIWPLASQEVQKAYSAGAPVYSETMKDWRIHAGADLKAESGEGVSACANGVVKQTYTDAMLGNVVVIEHGDYDFYYCGLGENFQVKEGDAITIGQSIGTVTAVPSESADAAHLHLEVRRDSSYLDPQRVIEGKD